MEARFCMSLLAQVDLPSLHHHRQSKLSRRWWATCEKLRVGVFNPFGKIYSSKWVHLPQFSGWKLKNIWNHHLGYGIITLGFKEKKTPAKLTASIGLPSGCFPPVVRLTHPVGGPSPFKSWYFSRSPSCAKGGSRKIDEDSNKNGIGKAFVGQWKWMMSWSCFTLGDAWLLNASNMIKESDFNSSTPSSSQLFWLFESGCASPPFLGSSARPPRCT